LEKNNMGKQSFFEMLQKEINRIDEAKTTKRHERIIEGFTSDPSPRALIKGKEYLIFNSNDYLGLRHHKELKKAELQASEKYGSGPGAVRFISGSLKVHRDLEHSVAKFHGRDDAIVFSSAFATNLAVMFCLSQGLTKTSLIDSNVFIVSDTLNHRSIIDGVRLTGLPKEQRAIFAHMDTQDLERVLKENVGKFGRVIVVTDGVFSMLGEYQHLSEMREVIDKYDAQYEKGIVLVMDEAHGVGIAGTTGRGIEEVEGSKADVLVGTFGKAFGADGGYVTADQTVIDYLRESSATYIYSNSIPPGTAGAALRAVQLLDEAEGKRLLENSRKNTRYFKEEMKKTGYEFSAESEHPIQPVLIGDTALTKKYVEYFFEKGILITNISYPVVPPGRDEIRVQISATHTKADIDKLVSVFLEAKKDLL
jgi:glycine C-acetyltransferase